MTDGMLFAAISIRELVVEAYSAVSGGRSQEDVLIDDGLNTLYLDECKRLGLNRSAKDLNDELEGARKDGDLPPTTKSQRHDHGGYAATAGIAARCAEGKFRKPIDRIMCDPKSRSWFDTVAAAMQPCVSVYLLRKAAFYLRKCGRLRPENIKGVADWDTQVSFNNAKALSLDLDLIPQLPGVYFFVSPDAWLYIGEADNLRKRVSKHLDHSDCKRLANFLHDNSLDRVWVMTHAFPKDSGGAIKSMRVAYEGAMILSRNPKFNKQGKCP